MDFCKSKVLPNIRKIFDKNSTKKTAAEEASRDFDDSRELITLEFEEKKDDIKNKVMEIHAVASLRTKAVVRERNKAAIKKNSTAVHKFLGELVKIDFPGAKQVYEYSLKFGPSMVSDPVNFVLEKVFIIITEEEKKDEATADAATKGEDAKTGEESKEAIVDESGGKIGGEPCEMEVEKNEKGEEIELENSEIVVQPMEPQMMGGEAAAPEAEPKA